MVANVRQGPPGQNGMSLYFGLSERHDRAIDLDGSAPVGAPKLTPTM